MAKEKFTGKNFIVKSKNDNQSFELEPTIEIKSELLKTKKAKQKMLPLNYSDKNNDLKTEDLDYSVFNENDDLRMTRGKAAELKQEGRLRKTKMAKQKMLPLNYSEKKKNLKTEDLDHSVFNENDDLRMTRGKAAELKQEGRLRKTKMAKQKMLPLNYSEKKNNLKTEDLDHSVFNENDDLRMTRGKAAELKHEGRLRKTKTAKQKMLPLNYSDKNNNLKTKDLNRSVLNENDDLRMTRGKATKLQHEERTQLDQILLNKYPNIKLKSCSVKMNDIHKEIQYLKILGLKYRFKCSLTNCKSKKKSYTN